MKASSAGEIFSEKYSNHFDIRKLWISANFWYITLVVNVVAQSFCDNWHHFLFKSILHNGLKLEFNGLFSSHFSLFSI